MPLIARIKRVQTANVCCAGPHAGGVIGHAKVQRLQPPAKLRDRLDIGHAKGRLDQGLDAHTCGQPAALLDLVDRIIVMDAGRIVADGPKDQVVTALRQTGARPDRLKLELTESLALDNVDDTIAKIGTLKTKGVRFSVDDFGTGYSSLAYLTRLPLDQLKIDQSFVRNLGVRHTDDVIVQTIIGMARNLELDVIAEGVETAQQKALLADYGCQLFQGYLLGMPGPVSELEVLLQQAATQASAEGAAG